eukprot:jgi/Galph1/1944/GphlegSOOS_G589.1
MSSTETVVYSAPRSRGFLVEWYLKEIGVPLKVITLDLSKQEHKSPEYLHVNPFGLVPALKETNGDMWSLFESGAILLYLAEKYDPNYPKDIRKRAELIQWIIFANSTLSVAAFTELGREKQLPSILSTLEGHFLDHEFVLGNQFSVADIALGSYVSFIEQRFPETIESTKYPHLKSYIDRMKSRQGQ